MPRLYVEPARLAEPVVVVAGEDHRYLIRVLRMVIGDVITLFDGRGGEADALVARIGPRALELKVELRRSATPSLQPQTTLIQALTKGDKLDLVVQKATELGINRILPVTTMRAVPRLDEAKALERHSRWQKIAREAARQCGRSDEPEVGPVTSLGPALLGAPVDGLRLFLFEGARNEADGLRKALAPYAERLTAKEPDPDPAANVVTDGNGGVTDGNGGVTDGNAGVTDGNGGVTDGNGTGTDGNGDHTGSRRPGPLLPRHITIAVGPEGGFADEEVAAARAAGFRVMGLGPRILRTETAALVALSILGYTLGDLG